MPPKGRKQTEEARAKQSASMSGRTLSPEHRAKISASQKGKIVSEETRAKISAVHKGKIVSDETRAKMSAAKRGAKASEKTRAKMSMARKGDNNPNFGKTLSAETRNKMSESHKGKPSHYKGKRHSPETRAKISAANRNRSSETRAKMSAAAKRRAETPQWEEHKAKLLAANLGKHRSPEYRAKMSAAKRGKPLSPEHRAKLAAINRNRPPPTDETCAKISASRAGKWTGSRSPTWKGGVSFFPYCEKFNGQRKRACRNFFSNHCIVCGKHVTENIVGGKTNRQKALSVHHIDHDKEQGCSGKPFNLVPLCQVCHAKELNNEEEYKKYINNTLHEGFKWGIWNEEEYIEKVMF